MPVITPAARAAIAAHATATYPDECVGLLLGRLSDGDVIIQQVFAAENRWSGQMQLSDADNAHSRRDRFYLDPRDYLRADRVARAQAMDVVGCYHSHPDHPPAPSQRDLVGAQGVGGGPHFLFVIQQILNGEPAELTAWILDPVVRQFSVCALHPDSMKRPD